MCTTYVADVLARRLAETGATVHRLVLLRCNPAVEYKTRGNAALAVHTDADPGWSAAVAAAVVERLAEMADDRTNPGIVVADAPPDGIPESVGAFARQVVTDHHSSTEARDLAEAAGYHIAAWQNGRGVIGALAAVGAWVAFDDWTYEHIVYRSQHRWGTERDVDAASVFDAAGAASPTVWDTVDRGSGETVCVPRTPGPVLYGIRGDDPNECRTVSDRIDGETGDRSRLFVTNQGTDAHLLDAELATATDGRSYRIDGSVAAAPDTREGGHVFVTLADGSTEIQCVAFEPTKRFRDHVRRLRVGDELTVCGEVAAGTLKLEKFAVRSLERVEAVTPTCPDCGRSMESAGHDQGYRCRDCGTAAEGPVEQPVERILEVGWYEVPPRARRHVAKPLVRGGFDAPVHPER
jgi:tRNA(Ile2)-agmatinylcytidine synthase